MPTELQNLLNYYLDCIARDRDDGISAYATSRFESDYAQIQVSPKDGSPWLFNINTFPDVRRLNTRLRQSRGRSLALGYPILVRHVSRKNGTGTFAVLEPVFCMSYKSSPDDESQLIPSEDGPRLNPEAIKHLGNFDGSSLQAEIICLGESIGLDALIDELPPLDEAAVRLYSERPAWNWKEEPQWPTLTAIELSSCPPAGIYNAAAFFIEEGSQYTQSLEKELSELQKVNVHDLNNSVFGRLVSGTIPEVGIADRTLIEPLELNDEQRLAVRSAIAAPLTVVTGPPGTGKSQVVASILINAAYAGKTVLFASKNNKAVDVVKERVDTLASRPVMIRLGRIEGGNERTELADYLASLLSISVTPDDVARLESAKRRHEELLVKVRELRDEETRVIELRNRVDRLERAAEVHRKTFGSDLFATIGGWDSRQLTGLDNCSNQLKARIEAYDRGSQSFVIRLLWFALEGKRKQQLEDVLRKLEENQRRLGIARICNDSDLLGNGKQLLDDMVSRIHAAREVMDYFASLRELQNSRGLSDIARDEIAVSDQLGSNSATFWDSWLRVLPNRLSPQSRTELSAFVTILRQLAEIGGDSSQAAKRIWTRYYEMLPRVTNILPCWGVTSLSARGRVPFAPGFFDLVVIDEASQCDIASALPLLFRARQAVIIGDPKQLPHISTLSAQEDNTLQAKHSIDRNRIHWSYPKNSLFDLAAGCISPDNLINLRDHHRSHSDIIGFSNREFYSQNLRIATKQERLRTIGKQPAVRWVQVEGRAESPPDGSCRNENEARTLMEELNRLMLAGYGGSIGVVSPFRAQVNRIRDLINGKRELAAYLNNRDFLVETVHKFQGDERDVMIFSPVLSVNMPRGGAAFLRSTPNLFNVSITRARAALIIVGNQDYCASGDESPGYMRKFAAYVREMSERGDGPAPDFGSDLGAKYPSVSSAVMVSDWEKVLYENLYKSGIRTLPQYQVGQYTLDLALKAGDRLLDIEVDGEMYHRDWDGELCRRDQLRNRRMIELGWDVMRFWVYEVRDDLAGCVRRVKVWAEGNVGK